jgi:hypothetical protein
VQVASLTAFELEAAVQARGGCHCKDAMLMADSPLHVSQLALQRSPRKVECCPQILEVMLACA